MSFLSSVQTALPRHKTNSEEVLAAAQVWLTDHPDKSALFERFLRSSNTLTRYFTIPARDIVTLHGSKERAKIFQECAPLLIEEVAQKALAATQTRPEEVRGTVFTSCSCPLIPAPDTVLFEKVGIPNTVPRVPLYQYGCAGGILGLGLADSLATTLGKILFISTELCSLVFQSSNYSPSHLVGASIFGDGAAAIVVDPNSGDFEIVARQSFLIPHTEYLMGYDILDSGAHLRLDKELPHVLVSTLPEVTSNFLKAQNLTQKDIPWWLFHPGGTKILDLLEETLKLRTDQCHWARDVLTNVGNMSSATILFVLKDFIAQKVVTRGDFVLMVGVGPGLTLEHLLLRAAR